MLTTFYGYRVTRLTTTDKDGRITGFLPLCSVNSLLTGRHLISLPFSDRCPLLAVDEASANTLIEQAICLARQQKVKYLELRPGANELLAQRTDLIESNLYAHWSIPLSERAEDVWSTLKRQVKQQVRKAQRDGVSMRVADKPADMSLYYNLHLRTRTQKHGMPSQSRKYFTTLWDTFATSGQARGTAPATTPTMRILLAEYEGMTIAGFVLFVSGTTLYGAYAASDENYLKLAPNNLLYWEAIKWGCEQGYKVLDLGRTARDNEGLMEFKRRWGAIQQPLSYYYFPHAAGLASTPRCSPRFRLLTTTWRKLPLSVTAPLGGWLYKHMG
jgi:FemAB-related protein (PEP-CTERM system-associated)